MGYSPMKIGFELSSEGASGQPSYFDSIMKGFKGAQEAYKTAYTPQNLSEALLAKQLENKMNKPKAEHAEELTMADIGYKNAQSERAHQLANQPFGGLLAGPAKEAYALEQVKSQYGEDSSMYKDARRAYDANVKAKEALTGYRGSLVDTAQQRALSGFGKIEHEENDVLAGYEPGTNRQAQISPERQLELLGQYKLQRQKLSSDVDTRKKVLFATNIDKTISRINPKDLVVFGGVGGQIELKKQEALAAANKKTSDAYQKYKEAETNATLLTKQVRQFYGDSIQPSVSAKLDLLDNPATWKNNPDIALKIYNSFIGTLKAETSTYKGALKSTDVYTGNEGGASAAGKDPFDLGL